MISVSQRLVTKTTVFITEVLALGISPSQRMALELARQTVECVNIVKGLLAIMERRARIIQ